MRWIVGHAVDGHQMSDAIVGRDRRLPYIFLQRKNVSTYRARIHTHTYTHKQTLCCALPSHLKKSTGLFCYITDMHTGGGLSNHHGALTVSAIHKAHRLFLCDQCPKQ